MKILYFARLRENLGLGEEEVVPPPEVATVAALLDWLRDRSPVYAEALGASTRLRCAVNQTFAQPGTRVRSDDEVAFFPPITGG
jgi:molybdopterin synthase sulfur carrier subunit